VPVYYELNWDSGTNQLSWSTLTSETTSPLLTFTHSTIFTPNILIYYRLRAKNRVGFGPYSESISVLTDTIPNAMTAPSTVSVKYNEIRL
jgi:hypothetical protein